MVLSDIRIGLQALLIADHIYHDQMSGKYVIAGTFHQWNLPFFPFTFNQPFAIFASLSGVYGKKQVRFEFIDAANNKILMKTNLLEIANNDQNSAVSFAIEIPPLYIPHSGSYYFSLIIEDAIIGKINLTAFELNSKNDGK